MPPATLSARVSADIGDFSRNLDYAGRKWEKFGRDLNQGASAMSRTFGSAGGSLSILSRGFETAGKAAGLFAGLDGIAGIASSLAIGGPLMAGLAALAALIALTGKSAEEAKKQLATYTTAVGELTRGELAQNAAAIQKDITGIPARRAALLARQKELKALFEGPGIKGKELDPQREELRQNFDEVRRLDAALTDLKARLDVVKAQQRNVAHDRERAEAKRREAEADALRTPEGQQRVFAERIGNVSAMLQQHAKGIETATDVWRQFDLAVAAIDARLAVAGDATGEMAIKLNALKVALIGARDAARDFDLDKIAKATAGAGVASAIANAPRMPGIGDVRATPSGATSVNMTGWVVPQPIVDLTQKTDEVKTAINSGFAQLPNALGSVLGGLLIPLFGNSRGAQVGGTLGGAFGAGVGSFIAGKAGAGIGSAIGGAVLPILGTAIGGLIGGAIGGLFGSSKKHMDDLAYAAGSAASAMRHFTTELLNGAAGFRIGAARFAAQTPMVMGSGGYFVEEGKGGSGSSVVLQIDGRTIARSVLNVLRTESQAQFGNTLRIAEVAL